MFFASLSLAAAPVAAACPTAADLDTTGVWIDFSDGSYVHYQRLGPEMVGEANHHPDGVESFFTKRFRGVWLTEDAPLIGDGWNPEEAVTFAPSPGEADWPPAGPELNWSGKVVTRDAGGVVINSFDMAAWTVGAERIHISGCDYAADVIRIEEIYEDGDQATEIRYLSELGVAYVAAAGPLGVDYEFYAVPTWIGIEAPR